MYIFNGTAWACHGLETLIFLTFYLMTSLLK